MVRKHVPQCCFPNKHLEAFDIENVVVNRAKFKQQEQKFMNVLPFIIELKSDENYELEVE